jgi:hypothetical protein
LLLLKENQPAWVPFKDGKKVSVLKKPMKLFNYELFLDLKQEYKDRVLLHDLTEEFGYKNIMQVPKLQKIVLSSGVGAAVADKKL